MHSHSLALANHTGAVHSVPISNADPVNDAYTKPDTAFGAFRLTGMVNPPQGPAAFCKTNMGECGAQSQYHQRAAYRSVTSDQWDNIHIEGMMALKPMEDQVNYGIDELWTYPSNGFADCEDYQIYNRKKLYDKYRVHPNDALFIVVIQSNRIGHLVQAVNTRDKGWIVSDNLEAYSTYPLKDIYQKYPHVQTVSFDLGKWYGVQKSETVIPVHMVNEP